MNHKGIFGGLGTIVLVGYMALNSQNVAIADEINTNKAGISSPAQKNQLTEMEKVVIGYINGLKENGLPDGFRIDGRFRIDYEARYPDGSVLVFWDENKKSYFVTNYDVLDNTTIKSNDNMNPSLYFRKDKKDYWISIMYRTIADKKPEITTIVVGSNSEIILYDEVGEGIFKKEEHEIIGGENKLISEKLVKDEELTPYFSAFKMVKDIKFNKGVIHQTLGDK